MTTLARSRRPRSFAAAFLLALLPAAVQAQVVACDFDIADNLGTFVFGNTLHLVGRAGASSNVGSFLLVNGNNADTDVDKDGYATGCDFNDIYIATEFSTNLTNVDNPSLSIPLQNIIVSNLTRTLPSGTSARVDVYVELPPGTVAGRYIGTLQVRDRLIDAAVGPNNEILNFDVINVEVIVGDRRGVALVDPDDDDTLDSLVVRGRAGQRASGVMRIANTGNTPLADVRLSASDLRAESAVGLVIPAANVTFAAPSFASLDVADTARVTVTVTIPRGILGGRYRGTITVQGAGAARQEIPLVLIVTSSRGLLFANNPVRGSSGDIGQVAFNGDPGTGYKMAIFDMSGLLVYTTSGTVFAGLPATGTPAPPGGNQGADFAVNVIWPLTNGRGEPIASGVYLVVVESTVNGQRQLAKDKLMIVR